MVVHPSLLSANKAYLGNILLSLLEAGCRDIHMDIMDGHYVPSLTFGASVIEDLYDLAKEKMRTLPRFHLHFMAKDISFSFLESFLLPGVYSFVFHCDAQEDIIPLLLWTKEHNRRGGLAFSSHCMGYLPSTPHHKITEYYKIWPELLWSLLDDILIMSVLPGKGGQTFQHQSLAIGEELRDFLLTSRGKKNSITLGIDGGITPEISKNISWADYCVVGSFLFRGSKSLDEKLQLFSS